MPIPGFRSVVLTAVVCVLMSGQVPLFAQTPGQTVEKALALKRAGSTPQAIRLLDERLASNPADGRAHYVMAWCLRDMGLGDAGRHFQLAIAWNITGADLDEAQAALKRMGVTVSLALPGDVLPGKTDSRSAEAPASSSEQIETKQPPDSGSTLPPQVNLLGVLVPPWVAGVAMLLLVLGVLSVILLICGAITLVGDVIDGTIRRVKRVGRTVGDTVSAVGTFAGVLVFLVVCCLVVVYLGNAVLGHQHNSGAKASRTAAVTTSRQALQGVAKARPTTEVQPQQTGGDSAGTLWVPQPAMQQDGGSSPAPPSSTVSTGTEALQAKIANAKRLESIVPSTGNVFHAIIAMDAMKGWADVASLAKQLGQTEVELYALERQRAMRDRADELMKTK